MSKKTWLSEFYPVSADAESLKTKLQRVQHSLQKWRGLREDALKRHNIKAVDDYQLFTKRTNNHTIHIDAKSCALCVKYSAARCERCPLAQARSGTPCDVTRPKEGMSPWRMWIRQQNPEPMIEALEKAEATLLRKAARQKK